MRLGVVHHVDPDRVDAQLLELGDVTLADGRVGERIRLAGAATGLVVDAADVEAVATSVERYGEVSSRSEG